MPVLQTRGAATGVCNACGTHGRLTEDHIPPKGCVRPTAMELQHVTDRLDAEKAIKSKGNDGVKYRTLCARCNNQLLGGRYDPALIDFVNRVSAFLASELVLPATMTIPMQPALVARAVWGHLAAVGVDRYQGPRTEELRDFFLDESLPIPAGLKFYYWLYPYRRQVLIRDAGVLDLQDGSKATYWAMKFYPLAFAVWHPATGNATQPMRDLATYTVLGPGGVVDVPLDLDPVRHELTLEAPTTTQAIMWGRDAIVANSRPPRGVILRP